MREQRPFIASAFAAIAVSFGLGRYGIGLFLPDMAREFALSDADLGFLASAGWAGYVVSSLFAMLTISIIGARALVAGGLVLSVLGMGLVSAAESPLTLMLGTILTGVSPGLVFAPVADAITARFEPERRGPAFAVVNAGEGAGTVVAGLIFLAVAPDWRTAWLAFALIAIVSVIASAATTPPGSVAAGLPHGQGSSWHTLFARRAWPLLIGSFIVGASTTVLWTFAGVLVDGATFAGTELRVVLWIVMGAAGVAAVSVAPILESLGLRRTYAASIVLTSVSAAGLALAANSPVSVLLAGAVFSFAYIMITSQIGAWALSIWPEMPAAGFGFTFLALSAGAVLGPAAAGAATAVVGLATLLLVTGLLTLGLLALLPAANRETEGGASTSARGTSGSGVAPCGKN